MSDYTISRETFTLKEMRRRNGWTAAQIATVFNVHINTIYNWELHPKTMTLGQLDDLLAYYGYDLIQLKR